MQGIQRILYFDVLNREQWLAKVVKYTEDTEQDNPHKEMVGIEFSSNIKPNDFEPFHLVTLACLIQNLDDNKYPIYLGKQNKNVLEFLFNNLKFREYWGGGRNYTPAQNEMLLNLWRIIDGEKEMYSIQVCDYLKRAFFAHKDLSAVQTNLDEGYYNISDHAEANGNAFSFIKFCPETSKLSVALCDFGKGIAKSIREYYNVLTDEMAILKSLEDGVTVQSKDHNRGLGMGNIISSLQDEDVLHIISNEGYVCVSVNDQKQNTNNFNFPGTLIYYELSLSHFEDEDILNTFAINEEQ